MLWQSILSNYSSQTFYKPCLELLCVLLSYELTWHLFIETLLNINLLNNDSLGTGVEKEEPTIYRFSRVNDCSRILCLSHNSYPHVLEEEN